MSVNDCPDCGAGVGESHEKECPTVMMSNISDLECTSNRIIEILEGALKKARAGELDSVFLCSTARRDGSVFYGWWLDDNCPIYSLLGVIESTKHNVVQNAMYRGYEADKQAQDSVRTNEDQAECKVLGFPRSNADPTTEAS